MSKKRLDLPGIGLRNIKTAFGVFLCILIYDAFQRPFVFLACISVVLCLKDTVQNSYEMAKDRMGGTIIGGIAGVFILLFNNFINDRVSFFVVNAILIGVGIVIVIYLCNILDRRGSTTTACIVLLTILLNLQDNTQYMTPHMYSINRMLDSIIGISIALLLNKYFFPFDEDDREEKDEISGQTA